MIPLTDERLRQLAYDDMVVCPNANERAMAAELLSARARIAALEAAQRPPLGYIAVEDSEEPRAPTGRWVVVPMSAIFPTAEECQPTLDLYTPLDGVTPARDARRLVAEVREVQP